jgi:hypothetical protein
MATEHRPVVAEIQLTEIATLVDRPFNRSANPSFVSNRKQLHVAVDTQRIYPVQRNTMTKVSKVYTIHGHL